ncbi:MAG: universal stress protein [Cyanobacteria bacterium REEB65]|nr:universal stress protein [Cyanobacteria bacterium REEB65]
MKILIATDGSRFSDEAVAFVRDRVQFKDAEIVVLTVESYPIGLQSEGLLGTFIDANLLAVTQDSSIKDILAKAKAALEADGFAVRTIADRGDPAEEILEYCRIEEPDLLVVGSHGRKGLERFFLGSVSARLVGDAPCPVLVVKPLARHVGTAGRQAGLATGVR